MSKLSSSKPLSKLKNTHPTRILLRGLAIALPPILTVVIVFWIFGAINEYIIQPTSSVVRYAFAHVIDNSVKTSELVEWGKLPPLEFCETRYLITPDLKSKLENQLQESSQQDLGSKYVTAEWLQKEVEQVFVPFNTNAVPYNDYHEVASNVPTSSMPKTAIGIYMNLVTTRYFRSVFHLSAVAVIITVILLYFIGRVMTVKLGQWVVGTFEKRFLGRVPVISNVYSSVKQVTDFFFSERTVSYNQVVAVEYPRKGVWSLGFVTGEGMRELHEALQEPVLALLMPTSPMPMTGFTIMVPKSDCIELDLTVDQAFQYCLSCGVLVPDQQKVSSSSLNEEIHRQIIAEADQPTSSEPSEQRTDLS